MHLLKLAYSLALQGKPSLMKLTSHHIGVELISGAQQRPLTVLLNILKKFNKWEDLRKKPEKAAFKKRDSWNI